MERLLETRAKKVERASTQRLRGVPADQGAGEFDKSTMTLPCPINGCLCVQDSEENPCPCTELVLWLPTFPKEVVRTGVRNEEGVELLDFILERDAVVFVDVQVPIQPALLERIARRARLRRQGVLVDASPPNGRYVSTGDSVGAGAVARAPDKGWLGLAGAAGWAIGGLLDDLLGSNEGGNDNLSDDLSDWAADNFPAPGWLQDIF